MKKRLITAKKSAKAEEQLGFETEIWNAACELWGHIPAAEHRNLSKKGYVIN